MPPRAETSTVSECRVHPLRGTPLGDLGLDAQAKNRQPEHSVENHA